jgi:uncharacterized protein (DUF2147 family)
MKGTSGAIGAIVALILSPAAAFGFSPYGLWQDETGRATVRVEPCGKELCGRVAALREPLDREGRPKVDYKNPDPALRSRPVMGLTVMYGFKPDGAAPGRWVNGTIYDADSGNTYQSTLTVLPDGTVEVRGYVMLPVIGRTSYWKPVN